MKKNNQNEEVKNIGSFFEINAEGIIVNPAAVEKISPTWMEPVQKVIEAYKEQFGDKLVSVYLRGSVAKGQAIEGISDLDVIALIDLPSADLEDLSWSKKLIADVSEHFPFVDKIEIDPVSISEINERPDVSIVLKTQAVCLFGKDVAADMPDLHPGPEVFLHLPFMERILENWVPKIRNAEDEEKVRRFCTSVMKRLVRSGCELVMERSQQYTRDLYPCWVVFSDYYPEKKSEMRKALELSVHPSGDKEEVIALLESLGHWLKDEYQKISK